MRLFFLAFLCLAACEACGPKAPAPKAEYGSAQCETVKCDDKGKCDCK